MYRLYLGNKNYSSWSLRGWLAVMLSRAPFTEVMVSLSGEGTPNPANRAFSPTARVPCLHDGTTVVWDSLAIAEYLAEPFQQSLPNERRAEAVRRSLVIFGDDSRGGIERIGVNARPCSIVVPLGDACGEL